MELSLVVSESADPQKGQRLNSLGKTPFPQVEFASG